eukprot:scaffold9208_cov154-Amphora_coffeaeformis.AAC.6
MNLQKKQADDEDDERAPPAEIVLMLENLDKGNNLGSILRCASASGVRQILAIGYEKCAVQGAHGADRHVNLIAFPTAAQAAKALPEGTCVIGLLGALPDGYSQNGHNVTVDDEQGLALPNVGGFVGSDKESLGRTYPVYALPASMVRPQSVVCLVVSKDRLGLSVNLANQCQAFCHVPCIPLAEAAPPLLDAPSSLTIALHHFTERLGYDEATFTGHKFHVIKPRLVPEADRADLQEQRSEERESKKHEADDAWEDGAAMGGALWGNDKSDNCDY